MQTSKHRSWFRCKCGNTFRSVTQRKRGLRKCPSCHLVADHPSVVPPDATSDYRLQLESDIIEHAQSVVRSYNMCRGQGLNVNLRHLSNAVAAWWTFHGQSDATLHGRQLTE